MFQYRTLALTAAVFGAMMAGIPAAEAGGYNSANAKGFGAVSARALAHNFAKYQGTYGTISQHSSAQTKSEIVFGAILTGQAAAHNSNKVVVGGSGAKVTIREKTEARTKINAKGKNVLLKARAKNYLGVKVDGKLWFENEQTAVAVGRHTPLGGQAASWARNSGSLSAKGLVRYNSGNVAKAGVTLR